MFRLGFDYLLFFNKHLNFRDSNYVSNYLVKKSFNNQPFYRSRAFGINCDNLRDNSAEYKLLKHVFYSI